MEMKTICIAGKNDIAVNVLLYCIKNCPNINIVVVCNKNDSGKNGWQKSLLWYAKKYDVKTLSLPDVYKIEDLIFLSLEFDRIIRPEYFLSLKLFNIHFSLLPGYKGCHTSVLPILHGQRKTGVTFHRIDNGIDTGEIIEQEEVTILPTDTSYDLYKKMINVGTNLVIKNLENVIKGIENSRKQNVQGSTYYSVHEINYANIRLDVNSTAYQIQNQVRAFNFRPYQLITWNAVQYVECEILDERSSQKPGDIIEDTETHTIIASIDYNVKLYKDVLTHIFSSIEKKENDRVKRLCESGQLLNAQDNHGWSPIIKAAYTGNTEIAEYLLERGADIHVKNWNGTTLLMYAKDGGLNTGDWTIFRILVKQGLDCNEKDYDGRTLRDYLLINKDIEDVPHDIKALLGL